MLLRNSNKLLVNNLKNQIKKLRKETKTIRTRWL